jgi:hypothetical protein
MPDTTALDQDLERRQRQLEQLDRLAQRFGTTLSTAFAKNAADGRRLDDVLNSVGVGSAGCDLHLSRRERSSRALRRDRVRSYALTTERSGSCLLSP